MRCGMIAAVTGLAREALLVALLISSARKSAGAALPPAASRGTVV